MRIRRAILILIITQGLAGCDSSNGRTIRQRPRLPSQPTLPGASSLVAFRDSVSGFSTTDLRDAEDEIVQLNSAGELILVSQHARLPGYRLTQHTTEYNMEKRKICPQGCAFAIRFGIKSGDRGASIDSRLRSRQPRHHGRRRDRER